MPMFTVQITASSVRLISAQTSKLVDEWKPPDERNISVANCNNSDQVACAVGRDLYYLEIQPGSLKAIGLVLLYEYYFYYSTPLLHAWYCLPHVELE